MIQNEQITIKGNRDKNVKGNDTLKVDKNRKEKIGKSRSLNVCKNNTELVKMAKSVTVGLAYTTQVGTIMNTAVGILQAEEVGAIKKTLVGKSYSIKVGKKFEISVGESKITMTPDCISITAKTILVAAKKDNVIIGKDVNFNPLRGGSVEESSIETRTIKPATGSGKPYVPPSSLPVLKPGDAYSAEHEKAITEALAEQKIQLEDAKSSLDDSNWQTKGIARLKKYFGNVSNVEAARQEKIGQLDRMIALNNETSLEPFKYFTNSKKIDPRTGLENVIRPLNVGASVYSDDKTHNIRTGNAFFNKVYKGLDGTYYNDGPRSKEERARQITHEMSHFDDIYKAEGFDGNLHGAVDKFDEDRVFGIYGGGNRVYGDTDSKILSGIDSKMALNHADTFSYFVSQLGPAF